MKTTPFIRLCAFLLSSILFLYAPWWVFWISVIAFLFYFPTYYEILVWGLVYDSVYGISSAGFGYFPYVCTAVSSILFLCAYILKKHLSVYE